MKRLPGWIYHVLFWLALLATLGLLWLQNSKKAEELPAGEAAAAVEESAPLSEEPAGDPLEERLSPPEKAEAPTPALVGVWVPYFSLAVKEHTEEAFRGNFKRIADLAREKGVNALFVHVRPFSDALYPSEYYPWSHILTGQQGEDPGFDPLAFMVEYTHSLGMAFHAWVNPLRVSTGETPPQLAEESPYSLWNEERPYYFLREGGLTLDPAYPAVRKLIVDGVREIVENYPVDGVHFDDYFYPGGEDDPDSEAYELYLQTEEEPLSFGDWRRANVSVLIQEVYAAVKQANPEAVFGVSPQGNLSNDEAMGADVRAWCAVPGYVDYLCPQLYYSFENPALGYGDALEQWLALPRHEGLTLYAGLALYKAGSEADGGTWLEADDNLLRQIEAARAAGCDGVVLYSSEYLSGGQTEKELANALPALAEMAG